MGDFSLIREKLAKYFQEAPYPVVAAYLFGSQAREETTALSDTDIGIYLDESEPGKRVGFYLTLLDELSRIIRDGEVDLIYLNDASPLLAYNIIHGRLIYCSDEAKRVAFEAEIISRYLDEQAMHRCYYTFLRQRILAGKIGVRSPEMIDKDAVYERLAHISRMLQLLKERRRASLEEFQSNPLLADATMYELQTCIEAMTDIGNHIIAACGFRKPQERSEIMAILAEEGVISQDLSKRLAEAVRLRNILVHGYLKVAINVVHRVLRENLGDVKEFARAIVEYLERVCE